jgi:hypothetical protein
VTVPTAMLDHLVVAANTLDQGSAYVQERLGVSPAGGGTHVAMGTHNRVLKLGPDRYLEVIAIDPDGRQPDSPRWFNLDHPDLQARLKERPRLIAWVARTDAVDALAAAVYGQRIDVRAMQRGALRWRFAFTRDGSLPGDGLIPHLIRWASGFETPTGGSVRADQDAHRRGGAGLIPIRKQRLWARACVLAQLKSSTQRCDAGGFNIAAALT